MIRQINNRLQAAYKLFFLLALIFVFIIAIIGLISGKVENYIPALIWLIILLIINFFFLATSSISFDGNYIYVKKELKKEKKYSLENVKNVQVTFNGYFTTIKVVTENGTKSLSCFNKIDSILKYNRADPFKFYRGFKNSDCIIDELKTYIKEKKRYY